MTDYRGMKVAGVTAAMLLLTVPAAVSAQQPSPGQAAERTKEQAERAADETRQKAGETAERTKEQAERAAERTRQQGNQAAERIETQGEQAKDRAQAQGGSRPLSDAWLTAKTKLALLADPDVSGTSINVDTKSGVVTLKGEVATPAEKQKALQIARGVEGVARVQDQLAVDPGRSGQAAAGASPGAAVATSPGGRPAAASASPGGRDSEQIARQVGQAIRQSMGGRFRLDGKELKGPSDQSISVQVDDDGIVTLEGKVQKPEDIVNAAQAARRVQGVRAVKTNIESEAS